jgi:hypothetical protein
LFLLTIYFKIYLGILLHDKTRRRKYN